MVSNVACSLGYPCGKGCSQGVRNQLHPCNSAVNLASLVMEEGWLQLDIEGSIIRARTVQNLVKVKIDEGVPGELGCR